MTTYRVQMTEEVTYEISLDADSPLEAGCKARALFTNEGPDQFGFVCNETGNWIAITPDRQQHFLDEDEMDKLDNTEGAA